MNRAMKQLPPDKLIKEAMWALERGADELLNVTRNGVSEPEYTRGTAKEMLDVLALYKQQDYKIVDEEYVRWED